MGIVLYNILLKLPGKYDTIVNISVEIACLKQLFIK